MEIFSLFKVEAGNLCLKTREISPAIQIFVDDGLPAQVCKKCARQVDSHRNFRLQCEESDVTFRNCLSNNLNNQNMTRKSHSTLASDLEEELVVFKEETAACMLEVMKQESASNNSQEFCDKNVEEHSQELRKVSLTKSRDLETASLEIKTDLNGFSSEKLHQELDTSNITESREQSINGNKDTEGVEKEVYDNIDSVTGNLYKCETCTEVFISKEFQEQHKCTTPYKCLICMKVLTNEADLCTHMVKHDNEPCRLCGKTFIDKSYYLKHLRTHSGLGHKCKYCNKLCPTLSILNIHVRKHTGEKPFVCEICGEGFARNQGYRCHMRKHTGERPFQCTTCLKTYLSKNALKNHIRIHTGEKPYVCDICGNSVRDQARLWHHTNTMHAQKEKKFKCSSCPKEYRTGSDLKAHIRMHTGERPYECQICGKVFALRKCLTGHVRIHTGEKKYGCSVCERTFSSSSSRDRHVRIHTGEAPFACATCDKAFSLRKDLINHVFKFQH